MTYFLPLLAAALYLAGPNLRVSWCSPTTSEKTTARRKKDIISTKDTGDLSVREVEEFLFHPGVIKNDLRVGEAILMLPHTQAIKVRLSMLPDLKPVPIPVVEKGNPKGIDKEGLGLIEKEKLAEAKPASANESQETVSVLSEQNNKKGDQHAA